MKKGLLIGIIMLAVGIVMFGLAGSNELMTGIGFLGVFPGLVLITVSIVGKFIKKKIISIPVDIIASILIFLVCTTLFITFFFPNETVRKIMQEEMSKALNRPVSIKSLSVSILKGISLHDLHIRERNGKGTFIRMKSFILSYKILPILTGNLVIYKAVLDSPTINIKRFKVGNKSVTSIDDLLNPPVYKKTVMMDPYRNILLASINHYPAPKQKNKISLPLAIHISELGMKNGVVNIDDTATAHFKNSYRLDNLDFIIEDFNWPARKPLKLKFNFQISLTEIMGGRKKTDKTFNIQPVIEGDIILTDKNGQINPTGSIVFKAENGKFYGQHFLKAASSFLEELKRDFFKGIKDAVKKKIHLFETLLKKRMTAFTKKAQANLDKITAGFKTAFKSGYKKLLNKRKKIISGFSKDVTRSMVMVEKDLKKFNDSVKRIFNKVTRLYPGAKNKLKQSKYINQAKVIINRVRNDFKRTTNRLKGSLSSDLDLIIRRTKTGFSRFINNLNKNFQNHVSGYASRLKKVFLARINKIEKAAKKYKVEIPFLKKKLDFKEARSTLEFKNGKVFINKLKIKAKDFWVRMDGYYGLDDSLSLKVLLHADKKYNKSEFTSLFEDGNKDLSLGFSVSGRTDKLKFAIAGKSVINRLLPVAAKKAEGFIKNFIGKEIKMDSLLSSFKGKTGKSGDTSASGRAMDKKQNNKKSALSSKQNAAKQKLKNEERKMKKKINDDAKKAVKKSVNRYIPKKIKKLW